MHRIYISELYTISVLEGLEGLPVPESKLPDAKCFNTIGFFSGSVNFSVCNRLGFTLNKNF